MTRPILTSVDTLERDKSFGVSVTVDFEGSPQAGVAAGTPLEISDTVARATLRAVESGRPLTLRLDGTHTMYVGTTEVAVVVVTVRRMRHPMSGSALIGSASVSEAFAHATLDAVNHAVAVTGPNGLGFS